MTTDPAGFNYQTWIGMFPEFIGVSQTAADNYFNLAQLYIRTDGRGPIRDGNMQTSVLYLTTAHLASMFSQQLGGAPVTGGNEVIPLVGRVANASQGSVKVQVDFPDQQPNAAWWNQTKYGAAVWAALKPYRTMRYIPPRRRIYNPPRWGAGGWGNWGGGWGGI